MGEVLERHKVKPVTKNQTNGSTSDNFKKEARRRAELLVNNLKLSVKLEPDNEQETIDRSTDIIFRALSDQQPH